MRRCIPLLLVPLAACDQVDPETFAVGAEALQKQAEEAPEEGGAGGTWGGPGDTVPTRTVNVPPAPTNCFVTTLQATCRNLVGQTLCAWNDDWAQYDTGTPAAVLADTTARAMQTYAGSTLGTTGYPYETCKQHYGPAEAMYTFPDSPPLLCGPASVGLSTQCIPGGLDDLTMDVETLYTFTTL